MTGRYPMRVGMQCGVVRPWASHGLPKDEQTLAEGMRSAGYATAVVGKWHLGHADPGFLPLQRGFEQQYGLNPLDGDDANGDADGDGSSNLAEYLNGTNPGTDDIAPVITAADTLVIEATYHVLTNGQPDVSPHHPVLIAAVGSVLAGAIFGDHCSPISDTTILSSLASGCDHIEHVRTQLPYAVTVGVVAILLGSIMTALGSPWWIGMSVGLVVLWLILRIFGKLSTEP